MVPFRNILMYRLILHYVHCAVVNVAVNEPSWQSTTLWGASGANDGRGHESCSHTGWNNPFCWWQVDIGKSYNITHVLLTGRNSDHGPRRLAGFSIYVSHERKDNWTQEELCFYDTYPQPNVAFERWVDCTRIMTGRYVVLYNKRPVDNPVPGVTYSDRAILELCEVNVPIEIVTCEDSFCTVCKPGWYGKRCEDSCENCGGGKECNKDNGHCLSKSCVAGYYFHTCTYKCLSDNCYSNECNFNTGQCPKCTGPYYGLLCNRKCPANCISCASTHNCTLCKSGWYGPSCSSSCSNCGGNGECQISHGRCSSLSCKTGFYGPYCDQICSQCAGDGFCDFITGNCTCFDGKYGDLCENDCPGGCRTCTNSENCQSCYETYYGPICSEICPGCGDDGSCSRSNGTCTSQNCKPKYYGNTGRCDQKCPSTCADDGSCDKESGNCSYGCSAGFYGSQCHQDCQNCRGGSCYRESGICSDGCNSGWNGTKCDSEVPGGENGSSSAAIIGPVVGGLVTAIFGIIVFIAFRRWRRTPKNQKDDYMSEEDKSASYTVPGDRMYTTIEEHTNQRSFQPIEHENTSAQLSHSSVPDGIYVELIDSKVGYINTTLSS